jgi:hypothetical protein
MRIIRVFGRKIQDWKEARLQHQYGRFYDQIKFLSYFWKKYSPYEEHVDNMKCYPIKDA